MNRRQHRIPGLDGLRALSIGAVLLGHLIGTRHFFVHIDNGFNRTIVFQLASLGVRVFFVVSGFLITGILLRELGEAGEISLSRFYFRRAVRIFLPYYAFLLAAGVIQKLGWFQLEWKDWAHALTYTSNYQIDRGWQLGHTWSLAVEEQFYLLWPLALLWLGRRRAMAAAGLMVLAAPLISLGLWQFVPSTKAIIGHRFETVADSLALGCLLAAYHPRLSSIPAYRALVESRLFILVPLVVIAANATHEHPRIAFALGYPIQNLGIALCLHWCLRHPSGLVGRVLNSRPLVSIGLMSYSIYLWQQIFLNRNSADVICQFPFNLIITALVSVLFYFAVERVSFQWRESWEAKLGARLGWTRHPAADRPGGVEAPASLQPHGL